MDVSELPPLIAGRYRPVKKLGEGNMGFIFEVEHERTGERLALKLMRTHAFAGAALLERFKREARASARIKSDHVVRVTDADAAPELGGALFLVMELLDGMDLDKAASGPLESPSVVVEWLRQTALGLDKAHQLGIVHRDLKPENLFLTYNERGEPRVKILDFGIAKTLEDAPGTTQSGQLLGTPLFMSPEQARTTDEVGPAADRYALGLIAYKLLTGIDYWEPSPNVAGVIAQILYHPMVPPSQRGADFGPDFDAWFARACHRDPKHRFGTAIDLVETLGRSLGLRVSVGALPAVTFGKPPEVALPPFIAEPPAPLVGGMNGSFAPTLSNATKDVTGTLSRKQTTRWAALAAVIFVIAGVAFWASRVATTLPSEKAMLGEPIPVLGATQAPHTAEPAGTAPAATTPIVSPVASAEATPPAAAEPSPAEAAAPPVVKTHAPSVKSKPHPAASVTDVHKPGPARPKAVSDAHTIDPLGDQK
jgi:serine/threonine-protein kinase